MGSDGRIGCGLERQEPTRQRVFSVDLPEVETPRGGKRGRTGPSELRSGKRRFRAGATSPLRRSGNGCGHRGRAKVRIEFPASRGQKSVVSVEHRAVACKSRCGEQNASTAARPKRHAQAEHAGWRASCERGSLGTIFLGKARSARARSRLSQLKSQITIRVRWVVKQECRLPLARRPIRGGRRDECTSLFAAAD
jgi:hypothetical protein